MSEEGITEDIKSKNQMLWVQEMNEIDNIVKEIILHAYVYEGLE